MPPLELNKTFGSSCSSRVYCPWSLPSVVISLLPLWRSYPPLPLFSAGTLHSTYLQLVTAPLMGAPRRRQVRHTRTRRAPPPLSNSLSNIISRQNPSEMHRKRRALFDSTARCTAAAAIALRVPRDRITEMAQRSAVQCSGVADSGGVTNN